MEFLCRIEMFGQLKVIQADQEQTRFRTHKIGWILAYLALHLHQNVTRERLVDLFWPDREIEVGRANLNNALSSLRRQLEPPGSPRNSLLIADRQDVRLNASVIHTDVQEFEESLRLAARATTDPERASLLERAAGVYRGELLPSCYEEWVGPEQQRLHNLYGDALVRWSTILEQAGDFPNALAVVLRAIKADAFREELYQREIRLYVALGQPAAALESYQEMERRWQAELGVSPSGTTRELIQQIQRNPQSVVLTFASTIKKSDTPKQDAPAPSEIPGSDFSPNSVSPLPLSLTRFFGRTEEQEQLAQMLQADETRLVTLVGTGGVGKTRLALEVARQLGPTFAGRVWWVSLADLPDARLLSSALTRALKLPASGPADPMEEILERLNESPSLLVLDNFEHLLRDETQASKGDRGLLDTGTILVRFLLERAPRLRCLVTSRLALRLNGEQELSLSPLPTPPVSTVLEEVLDSPSVSLYVDRARLARADFALTAHNAESIARLCRQLEGIPLAIEMAAAWAKVLPPAKMLERLEERLDALTSRGRDLPARHQSLRATIDWSYDLLDAPQRRLLARLSVFRGGWTLEAAEAICADQGRLKDEKQNSAYEYDHPFSAATVFAPDVMDVLVSLVDKSLVVSEEKGDEVRYRLLETVRQYSAERLRESGDTAAIQERHYAFFRDMAGESIGKIRGSEQLACLDQLEREHDNIRAALAWARTETGNPEAELDLAGKIRPFWDIRSYWREGRERLEAALEHAPRTETEIRARALLGAGVLAANMRDFTAAQAFYEECLHIRRQLGDSHGVASVAMGLGNVAQSAGDFAAAQQWLLESLELARKLEDTWLLAAVLGNLGIVAESQRDYTAQQHYHEECLQLHRKIGNTFGIATAYSNLGNVSMRRKDFVASYGYMAESLLILRQLGEKRILSRVVCQIACMEMMQGREATNGVRLMAAGQSILEQIGTSLDKTHQRNMNSARQEVGEEVFATAFAQGHALSYEQTIEEALTITREGKIPRTEHDSVS